jgi:hypothetical protein
LIVVAKKSSPQITQRYFPIGPDSVGPGIAEAGVEVVIFSDSGIRNDASDTWKL